MDETLPVALVTVLRDVRAQCGVQPTVAESVVQGWEEPVLMITAPDGTGVGLRKPLDGDLAHQVADVADQVQEWAVHALWMEGLPAVWPECPEHPDTHPLAAGVVDGVAVWACPKSRTVTAEIGRLPGISRT